MLTVLLTALVLGVFIPVVQATTGTANRVRNRVVVNVYLAPGATQPQIAAVHAKLVALPNAKQVQFISKAQALRELQQTRKGTAEAFQLLGTNPLPDTYRVVPKDPGKVQDIVTALVSVDPSSSKRAFALPGIGDVRNRESDTSKILTA